MRELVHTIRYHIEESISRLRENRNERVDGQDGIYELVNISNSFDTDPKYVIPAKAGIQVPGLRDEIGFPPRGAPSPGKTF
jgi:hypothetical protein